MNSYNEVFRNLKSRNEVALIAFTVIGYPDYKTSIEITLKIADSGADILELGIPFSDPIADGKIIQAADARALENGMNTDMAFDFVKSLRKHTDIPIGLLTYYNIVYQRGLRKFYQDAYKAGVNSILIADLPIEESDEIIKISKENKTDAVFMISQLSDDRRIRKITSASNGFIYIVSRLGVTGVSNEMKNSTISLIKKAKKFTGKPLCVGFGISTPEHVRGVISAGADGAIVGSAIVEYITNYDNKGKLMDGLANYIRQLKNATKKLK